MYRGGAEMGSRSLSHYSAENLEEAVSGGNNLEGKRMSMPEAKTSRNMKMMAQT